MSDIFLSYSRESEKVVTALAEDLESLGHSVWFDQDLSGGQPWWDRILETIRDSDIFVFALAPQSIESTACQREFRYAADLGKPILPVLVADGVSTNILPPALSEIHIVEYRDPTDRGSALKLARALNDVPAPGKLPDPLPAPPAVPISYLGGLAEQIGADELSHQEQSLLVIELKRSLNDGSVSDDAVTLLKTLRQRRDLYASIADEIDELLARSRGPDDSQPDPFDATEDAVGSEPRPQSKTSDDPEVEAVKSRPAMVRRFTAFFDRERFGSNFYVGLALFVGALLSWIGHAVFLGVSWNIFLVEVFIRGVYAAVLFTLIVNFVSRDWMLPLWFGASMALIGLLKPALYRVFEIAANLPAIPFAIDLSIGGFLFVAGLVVAVRLFGLRAWSLMLGAAAAQLAFAMIKSVTGFTGFMLWPSPLTMLLGLSQDLIAAFAIYIGIALHLRRTGHSLSSGGIEREQDGPESG